jgi:hypothetical protein
MTWRCAIDRVASREHVTEMFDGFAPLVRNMVSMICIMSGVTQPLLL